MKTPALSTTTSIIILVVFVAGVYFFGKPSADVEKVKPEDKEIVAEPAKLVDPSLIQEKNYKLPNDYIVFDVVYPSFINTSVDFNKKIEALVTSEIDLQKKYAKDAWEGRYNTSTDGSVSKVPKADEKFSMIVSYDSVQVNNSYISVLLSISGYSGGAHGYQNLYSFNYDVKAGKEVALKDLFPNDPNYLKTISEFVRIDLETQLRQRLEIKTNADKQNFQEVILPMLLDGTTAVIENFKVFTFTPDATTIYFVEYQVGPYAMGESTVVIPK
jgi:hypothetical protein